MGIFQEATAVRRVTPGGGEFAATLDRQWSVGGKLHGGYLLAVLGRAAGEASGAAHPHVTAVSGSFLAPPGPGPAEVLVETLRAGKSVTQVRARLAQDGRPCVEALIALGLLDESGPWWSGTEPVDLPDEQECVRTPPVSPGGDFEVPLMEVVEQRLDPGHLAFTAGAPSRQGVISGYQRLADGTDWDPLSLLVALDPVPPVSYDLGISGWAPTVQFTAYVRRLPVPGPVRVRMRSLDVSGGRMDEVANAWDAKGRLVAQASQLAAVRVPDAG
ncbi:thioesterase family protein [Sphaerisporangium corydalis]|uniref:Thioesterase family protein n=1 Tax=Sphaerisporangium corydalis TaxID=1441875 RepID=A0ABV9EN22_9ACTN|nr:thioesterase family protein [Sphaerisporangium corydalis]